MSKKEFISLKEAGKLSGYSADYIGQLIRGGKLEGKQVFSNVSWVTTEEAILEYLKKEKGTDTKSNQSFFDRVGNPQFFLRLYSVLVWVAIGIFVLFVILLAYVFSVSIDHSINQKYLEDIQKKEAGK